MDKYKIIGILQFVVVLSILTGFIAKNGQYWFALDILIIIICGFSGLTLLIKGRKT
jgi:hypothetical protein